MNRLTLAVAGGRKTQSIVDACVNEALGTRRLMLTYTQTGQAELEERLRKACRAGTAPIVMGWFSFLLHHWIRPYLPLRFPGRHLHGLNFDGEPPAGRYSTGAARYLDSDGRAYRLHLSKLAYDVSIRSNGAVVDRLSRIFDEIYVDEVQDLTGCDLHILHQVMRASGIDLYMVGDVRQSVFDTNPRDPNLKQYRGVKMLDWFEIQRTAGILEIEYRFETWRANQAIANFSDRLFPAQFSFGPTISQQRDVTGHDGVFAITVDDVPAYMNLYSPQPLRESKAIARGMELPFRNFGKVKGATFDRVMIWPTRAILDFLKSGQELKPRTACGLYVAVTRARHSVVFVVPDPTETELTAWSARPPDVGDTHFSRR